MSNSLVIDYDFKLLNIPTPTDFSPFSSVHVDSSSPWYHMEHWKRCKIFCDGLFHVSYYNQAADKEVDWHSDTWGDCCYNMVIKGTAPIVFESGPVYYRSALININERHMVPAGDERLILKINIKKTFDHVALLLDHHFDKGQDIDFNEFIEVLR